MVTVAISAQSAVARGHGACAAPTLSEDVGSPGAQQAISLDSSGGAQPLSPGATSHPEWPQGTFLAWAERHFLAGVQAAPEASLPDGLHWGEYWPPHGHTLRGLVAGVGGAGAFALVQPQ